MLFPLHAHERSPWGLTKLASGVSVEGGMVGEIEDPTTTGDPEVILYDDGTANLHLVGLIDDSSTAADGVGVTGIGVSIGVGVTPETGSPTGPATHLASRKVTLWMDPGMFVTDTWDTTDSVLGTDLSTTSTGVVLRVDGGGTDGLLQADAGSNDLGLFVRRFVGGQAPVDDFDSYFIPRVQPLPEGRVFMVFRFKL